STIFSEPVGTTYQITEPLDLSFSGLRSTIEDTIYGYRQGSMGIENIGVRGGGSSYYTEPASGSYSTGIRYELPDLTVNPTEATIVSVSQLPSTVEPLQLESDLYAPTGQIPKVYQ